MFVFVRAPAAECLKIIEHVGELLTVSLCAAFLHIQLKPFWSESSVRPEPPLAAESLPKIRKEAQLKDVPSRRAC